MPIDRAIEFYLMVSGAIYFVFERLERFSNKADLELYYRMLTIKRENLAPVWREAIIRFFDKLFGAGARIGSLTFPLFSRVVLLTGLIHLFAYFFLFRSMSMSIFGGTVSLLQITTSFLICLPFDFISFAKTRAIIQAGARSDKAYYSALLIFIDMVGSVLLGVLALFVFATVFFSFVVPLAEHYPAAFSTMFRITKALDPDGTVNWRHTFESIEMTDNLVVNATMELASAGVSSFIVCLLVLSLACAWSLGKLSAVQDFLDSHTSIGDKPLQIVGAIAVVLFSIVFWTAYAISRVA